MEAMKFAMFAFSLRRVVTIGLLLALATSSSGAEFKVNGFGEADEIKRKIWATHFLMRTTFGPTTSEVDALALRIQQIGRYAAFEEWIDDQFDNYPISTDWETYEVDRGRVWPLAKKMLQDMGYEESELRRSSGPTRFWRLWSKSVERTRLVASGING